MNLRVGWLNRATVPLFRLYGRLPLRGLERLVVPADLLVCESHAGLLLFERFAQLAPAARTVYRVSDSLDLLDVHPCIQQAEQRFAARFDRVSSPCEYLHRRFDGLPQSHMDFHGVAAEAFEAADSSPYPDDSRPRAVYVGTAHVDTDFLARAARLCPEVEFHVIGPITGLAEGTNLVAHGSMSFARTAAFVRHADVALACRTHGPGAESLTDSLKIRQYAYCRLPIVLPEFLADGPTALPIDRATTPPSAPPWRRLWGWGGPRRRDRFRRGNSWPGRWPARWREKPAYSAAPVGLAAAMSSSKTRWCSAAVRCQL
jgi:2-beta-glucuronyltransferase